MPEKSKAASLEESKSEEHISITSSYLLLVEGKDEYHFFNALLEFLTIKKVQVHDVGGKDKFKKKMTSFVKIPGFSNVKKLGFVRDAEKESAKRAFDSICDILKANELPCPKSIGKVEYSEDTEITQIGIFIMPNNKDEGMLENLCLSSIENDPFSAERKSYMSALKEYFKENKSFNIPKAETQIYLASKVPIVTALGLGAEKGYWDFNNSAFDDIKKFLRDLFC
ncbi:MULTISPECIES: DUF3226 domain-containing protein [Treponema]|uniref:DUF4435 domain-containing protein n=1 Tax=Treponema denticola OTK TaxID=999434 RepID=A0A0F6MSF7_TREDN|nr:MULTISPECIES: DUF3226 domain-containing protein [Treponema]EMB24805.1 hypothetical protein HMPREF9723_00036 [Treponema denticola OTK]EMB42344.1 hypothetical protein HMPREF9729_02368 [Treponema denticola ASLM]EMD56443.1 hypothetical protein HMPREF9728_01559 [Treponema denticola US-Trep]UTD09962.1 hypothetical protein HYB91_05335 [Treponema sp. B152]